MIVTVSDTKHHLVPTLIDWNAVVTMVERTVPGSAIKVVSKKTLCFFFAMTTLLFMLSWLFVLRSTRPDATSNSSLFSSSNDAYSDPVQQENEEVETSFGNRAILGDSIQAAAAATTTATHDGAQQQLQQYVPEEQDVKCKPSMLRVFMYDLPPEFHFGLLDWKPQENANGVWPDIKAVSPHYPGGLNLQHSIEYWLTMDLLASELPEAEAPSKAKSVMRVRNSSEADVIFVPFFSSLCYNRFSKTGPHEKRSRNKVLQEKLVNYVTAQEEWKRSGGKDHVILAHHPNSMLDARTKLWPGTFILSDFGRYPPNVANVEKDVIAPYKHVVGSYDNDQSSFDSRPILLYFQGAIYRKDVCFFHSLMSWFFSLLNLSFLSFHHNFVSDQQVVESLSFHSSFLFDAISIFSTTNSLFGKTVF